MLQKFKNCVKEFLVVYVFFQWLNLEAEIQHISIQETEHTCNYLRGFFFFFILMSLIPYKISRKESMCKGLHLG